MENPVESISGRGKYKRKHSEARKRLTYNANTKDQYGQNIVS